MFSVNYFDFLKNLMHEVHPSAAHVTKMSQWHFLSRNFCLVSEKDQKDGYSDCFSFKLVLYFCFRLIWKKLCVQLYVNLN